MGATTELPLYNCHKQVRAAKITSIRGEPDGSHVLVLASLQDDGGDPLLAVVPADFIAKHSPAIGGYFVLYKDGYSSYSPADAFEDGYALAGAKLAARVAEELTPEEKAVRQAVLLKVLESRDPALRTAAAVIQHAEELKAWITGAGHGN